MEIFSTPAGLEIEWGNVKITRRFTGEGHQVITLSTPITTIEIRVCPDGFLLAAPRRITTPLHTGDRHA